MKIPVGSGLCQVNLIYTHSNQFCTAPERLKLLPAVCARECSRLSLPTKGQDKPSGLTTEDALKGWHFKGTSLKLPDRDVDCGRQTLSSSCHRTTPRLPQLPRVNRTDPTDTTITPA